MSGMGQGGGRGQGQGRGRMGGNASGTGGECRCPNCGYTVPHQVGVPCYQQTCPKCGTNLVRA
jgi:ssDNA-binding Zn-finger/Zn-ribbon topoisomerase 1